MFVCAAGCVLYLVISRCRPKVGNRFLACRTRTHTVTAASRARNIADIYACMHVYMYLIFQTFRFVRSLQFALSIGTHKSQTIFQFQISQLQLQIFFAGLPSVRVCVSVRLCVCVLAVVGVVRDWPTRHKYAACLATALPFSPPRAAVDQVGGNSRKRRQAAKNVRPFCGVS